MRHLSRLAVLLLSALACTASLPPQSTPHHEFAVAAGRYAFSPSRLEVHQGDLVRITVRSEDIAHSFVIDAYRVAKRIAAGATVIVEFLADQAGEYPFYCNLTADERCREMRGLLVVAPTRPSGVRGSATNADGRATSPPRRSVDD